MSVAFKMNPKAFLIIILVLVFGRQPSMAQQVYEDTTFNQLFTRSGDGFTGGDGTYSVLLPDGRTVWIFGDTFLGEVAADSTRIRTEPMYIRNTFVVQNGENLDTIYRGSSVNSKTLITPPAVLESKGEITEDSLWYWPGDGFIKDDELHVFVSEFHQFGDNMWDFEWLGGALASFSLPDLKQTSIYEIPDEKLGGTHFGHAVYEGDQFLYIYGLKEGFPYAARIQEGNIEADWEYYSDGKWIKDVSEATPVLEVGGSEQFSVFKIEESYYFLTQLGGFSNEIWVYQSDHPYDWEPSRGNLIYTIELPFDNSELFTYNTLAHPQFINQEGELLISYNTNSHRLQDHFENAHIYKPRFIRVPLKLLK
jgi:hypothetical protein